jgi:hypothetical protein
MLVAAGEYDAGGIEQSFIMRFMSTHALSAIVHIWTIKKRRDLPFENRKLENDSPVPAFCPMQLEHSPMTLPTSKDLLLQMQSISALFATARLSNRRLIGMLDISVPLPLPFMFMFISMSSFVMLVMSTSQVITS